MNIHSWQSIKSHISIYHRELPGMVNGSCVGKAVGDDDGDVTEEDSLTVDSSQTISKEVENSVHDEKSS